MVPSSLGSTASPSRPSRWRAAVSAFLAVLAPLALAACAGGGGGGGEVAPRLYASFDPASTTPRACASLALSAAAAEPLDTVTISGLPPEFTQVAVFLETIAGRIGQLYPTGPVVGGQAEFMVPVSPDGALQGAAVNLTVTDAVAACPAMPFTIDPLPAATGDYDTYMADLNAAVHTLLDVAARAFGSDYATLSAAAAPPANEFLPIYLAIHIFESTLVSPAVPPTDDEKALLLRLLEKAGAVAVFTDAGTRLDGWLTANGAFPPAKPSAKPSAKPGPHARSKDGDCVEIAPEPRNIASTAQLSAIMSNPAAGDLSGAMDGLASAMAAMSSVLGVAGLSGPTDALGALASIGGMVTGFAESSAPSAFTSLTFDAQTPIWEDMAPNEAAWSNAQANVTSTPFSITRAAVEQMISLASLAGLPGWAITVVTYSYDDEVDQALDNLEDFEGAGCVRIGAQQWGPFDVTSSAWTDSEILGSTITKKTHETYVPAMLGQSEIRVRIKGQAFGGATIAANNFVTVNAKTVSISPISPKVDKPGDPVHLVVSVNAFFPEAVTPTPPAGAGPLTHKFENGVHTYDFNSPGSENQFPAPFRVESTSGEVPPNDFERADSVDIVLNNGLEITGERSCIRPGEVVDLEAVLTGYSDPDAQVVTWTASAGTAAAGSPTRLATYTAPGTLGTVVVRAETPAPGINTQPASDQVQMLVSDSCIRQFFTAYLISTADGDPDCDGPQSLRSDIPEEADSVDTFEDIAGMHVPTPQGNYFGTGTVSLDTLSSFPVSRPITQGGVDSCASLLPFAQGSVHISSTKTGEAAWDASFTDRGTCVTDDSGPYCDVGDTGYVVGHYMYVPIQERGTYKLSVDLSCTLYPHYGDLQVFVGRYMDGTDFTLPNGPDSVPTAQNPQPDPPFVQPIISLPFECTGSTQNQSVVMDLAGPLGTTGTDLVTIYYITGPTGFLGGLTTDEILENAAALDPATQGQSPEFLHDLSVTTKIERLGQAP